MRLVWNGLVFVLPPCCVFVVVNHSIYYPNIVVVFTISCHCTIFSPQGNLFYTDSSFHFGKLPDEMIQIRQTELVLGQTSYKGFSKTKTPKTKTLRP